MKYGSIDNILCEGIGNNIELQLGMGITVLAYTDRYPATIISISKSSKSFQAQQDKARRIDGNGMSDCQQYVYERDENGCVFEFRKAKNGRYYTEGGQRNGYGCIIGTREKYYDFTF